MVNGWFIFNSRFSDVRADLHITSAAHYGSDMADIIVYTFLIAETHALILTIEPLNNFF